MMQREQRAHEKRLGEEKFDKLLFNPKSISKDVYQDFSKGFNKERRKRSSHCLMLICRMRVWKYKEKEIVQRLILLLR